MKALAAALLFVGVLSAQEVKAPPALSEVQRLQLQNLSQQLEIAQLKAQAAQRGFDRAREDIARLVLTLQVPGYSLDLQTLSYVAKPEKETP